MKVKNFCRGVLSKIKGGAHKVHDKYRAKFPKKVPKLNDGKLHDRKFVLKLAIASNLHELRVVSSMASCFYSSILSFSYITV